MGVIIVPTSLDEVKLVCIKGLRRVPDYESYQDPKHLLQAKMVEPRKMKAVKRKYL